MLIKPKTKKILSLLSAILVLFNSYVPVMAEDATPSASPDSIENTATEPSPPIEEIETLIEPLVENVATISSQTEAVADSGENTQIASDSASMQAGETLAVANSLTETNITTDDPSQIDIDIIDDTSSDSSIDLSQNSPNNQPSPSSDTLTSDSTTLTATTSAIANTGNNIIIASDQATLTTQNATAVANAINLVNLQIDNSQVIIFIINVYPESDASIILPRPELYSQASTATPSANPIASNTIDQTDITSLVAATASTGNNTTLSYDLSQISTGDAYAISQQLNYINLFINGTSYFLLTINHPFFDYTVPQSNQTPTVITNPHQTILTTGSLISTSNPTPETNSDIQTNQDTTVNNQVIATANTGNNFVQADHTNISTGISTAIANMIQIINTTISNSKIFIGIINFLGSFTGQTQFNYPDIAISSQLNKSSAYPGDNLTLTTTITNLGLDLAHQPQITISLPHNISFSNQTEEAYQTFSFDNLGLNQSQTITIPLNIQSDAINSLKIHASATINDPEINIANNQAEATILVTNPPTTSTNLATSNIDSESDNNDLPFIEISAINNAVDPINPGDTITFEIKINNLSAYSSFDNIFYHQIFDKNNQLIGELNIPLGDINPYSSGILHFGITAPIDSSWGMGQLSTRSQVTGHSKSGQIIDSNLALTTFGLKSDGLILSSAKATADDPNSPTVLGLTYPPPTDSPSDTHPLLTYVFIFLLSLQYLIKNSKINSMLNALLYGFAFISFLFAVYSIASQNHIIHSIASIDINFSIIEGKLRQFL